MVGIKGSDFGPLSEQSIMWDDDNEEDDMEAYSKAMHGDSVSLDENRPKSKGLKTLKLLDPGQSSYSLFYCPISLTTPLLSHRCVRRRAEPHPQARKLALRHLSSRTSLISLFIPNSPPNPSSSSRSLVRRKSCRAGVSPQSSSPTAPTSPRSFSTAPRLGSPCRGLRSSALLSLTSPRTTRRARRPPRM